MVTGSVGARAAGELARGALVVLDVARALDRLGVEVALELLEDLPVGLPTMLASTLSRPRWAMPMTASASPAGAASSSSGVEEHDGRLGALEAEALLADVAGVEEPLEGLGGVQALEDVALLLGGRRRRTPFDVLLDPALLLGLLDVHVLDADRPAVGVAQDSRISSSVATSVPGQAVGDEAPRSRSQMVSP